MKLPKRPYRAIVQTENDTTLVDVQRQSFIFLLFAVDAFLFALHPNKTPFHVHFLKGNGPKQVRRKLKTYEGWSDWSNRFTKLKKELNHSPKRAERFFFARSTYVPMPDPVKD